jgi:hypothetical protein
MGSLVLVLEKIKRDFLLLKKHGGPKYDVQHIASRCVLHFIFGAALLMVCSFLVSTNPLFNCPSLMADGFLELPEQKRFQGS